MSFETSHARWQAVTSRLRAADGQFVYAVKSTMIYCRPTCSARLARRANVDFYRTPADAEAGGYRACKRCKPEVIGPAEDGQGKVVQRACDVLAKWARTAVAEDGERASAGAASENKTKGLKELACEVGKTPRYLHKIFKDRMVVTPKQYAEQMTELYRPASTAAIRRGNSGMTPGAHSLFDAGDELFEFTCPELDFVYMPMLGPNQAELDDGQVRADNALFGVSLDGGCSPETLSSMPMTPDNLLNHNESTSEPGPVVIRAGDLPALSPTALDSLLSNATAFDSLSTKSIDWQGLGGLSDWVWEAEWSNAVIDGYQRTAAIL